MQIEERIEEFFVAGGIVAWPLLAFSVVVLALVAERAFFWFRVNQRQVRVIRSVLSLYRDEPFSCLKLLRKNPHFPLARIFLEALELRGVNPEVFRLALESAAQAEFPKLKRFSTVFDTIITVAPLLGLMGTIIGLMRSFSALKLGDIGTTNTTAVTGGISEALVSTVMGLTVAIVTLLFSNVFRSFYRRQLAVIQEYGGQLELLYRLKYEEGKHIIDEEEEIEEISAEPPAEAESESKFVGVGENLQKTSGEPVADGLTQDFTATTWQSQGSDRPEEY